MIEVRRHPLGPRLYAFGCRVHHGPLGLVGAAICAATHRSRLLTAFMIAYGLSDWRDFPWRDSDNH